MDAIILKGMDQVLAELKSRKYKYGISGRLQASIGAYLARITKSEMSGPTPPISPLTQATRAGAGGSNTPLKDTGQLVKSITWARITDGVEVGSPLRYARIHQEGGVIKPKKAKKLAIPWTREAALMASTFGVRGAIEKMSGGKGVWFNEGSIFIHGILQFLRMKQVTIPKREYLVWNQTREDHVSQMVINFMEARK